MKTGTLFGEEYKNIKEYLDNVNVDTAKIVLCERIDEKSRVWNFNRHSHDHTEFLYILDGKIQIDVPGGTLNKQIYNLIMYPPNVSHQEIMNLQEAQCVICIGIKTEERYKLSTALEFDDLDGKFRWIFEQIFEEYVQKKSEYEKVIQRYISILYILLSRYYESRRSRSNDFVSRCICYIEDHISENLTVQELSAVAYVSAAHLTRTFRQQTGYSPQGYIRACRLNIAKRKLLTTNDSIEEIATKSGFHDAKYFSRFFKQEMGVPPREFRKKNAWNKPDENNRDVD